jgi:hypothetical protein
MCLLDRIAVTAEKQRRQNCTVLFDDYSASPMAIGALRASSDFTFRLAFFFGAAFLASFFFFMAGVPFSRFAKQLRAGKRPR